jgi:hypothetical protein
MSMHGRRVLFLNASNMETYPVYPYAFIQVPAIARRSDIEVICKDLLGIPRPRWEQTLRALIERHQPAMVLITLRNTDSLGAEDYERNGSRKASERAYFPIERTKELIATIREVSDPEIALGGFGFSVLPDELMHYLRPDFGVFGGPDAFFAHFGDIDAGRPAKVANLLFFQDGQLVSTPRTFYPPFAGTEYTPSVIREMMGFYDSFPTPGFQGAPVEIMRGCNHCCAFCSEPHVKGAQVHYRALSDVMADIEMLVDHGITRVYMISSELNPESNEFILQLAERIRSFNERQTENRKITWFGANYLLGFDFAEYERLYSSGFAGGWFDITALDDENARAMRTPYRNERLLAHLKSYAAFEKKQLDLRRTGETPRPDTTDGADGADEKDETVGWTMFLGNPATTMETIRNTLRTAHQEGLPGLFDSCSLNAAIRVFDYEEPTVATLAATYSVTPDLARTSYQQLLPSFAYPPALLADIGSEREISAAFDHIAETYLSIKYQETRNWHGFITQRATVASISRWVAELSDLKGVYIPTHLGRTTGDVTFALQELFAERPPGDNADADENRVKKAVDLVVSACLQAFPCFFESLGLPSTAEELDRMTAYELAVAVFSRWYTEKDLVDELTVQTRSVWPEWKCDLLRFCAQAILYKFNILIRPQYSELFIPRPGP